MRYVGSEPTEAVLDSPNGCRVGPAASAFMVRRWLAGCTIVAAFCGTAALVIMEFLPRAAGLNPWRVPLSDYVLIGKGALFSTGVVLLAVGTLGVAVALTRASHTRDRWASALLIGCAAGLITLTVFPETMTPTGGPTMDGWLHFAGCLPAFIGPPAASMRLAYCHRRRRARGCSWLPTAAGWLGPVSGGGLVLFAVVQIAPVWRLAGAIERGVAALDVAMAVLLAVWVWRGCCGRTHPDRATGRGDTHRRAPHTGQRSSYALRSVAVAGHTRRPSGRNRSHQR